MLEVAIALTLVADRLSGAPQSRACLSAKLEPSVGVIAQMKAAQLDLARPRTVSHLFLGADKKLAGAARSLTSLGYVVQEQGHGRLLVVSTATATLNWVQTTIPKMCEIATSASVDYDGWDIDVADDNIQTKPSN